MATGRIPTTANSPLTVKGDLFGYSTTQARVPVGNDGETLVADSSTSTGLRYNPTSAAGKNAVINGGFDIWQRGTSLTSDINKYTADRWLIYRNQTTSTISRQATGDTTNLPFIQYCLRFQRNAASTSTATSYLSQSIETINSIPFAGKTVTYSFYARKGADFSNTGSQVLVRIATGTGTDQNAITGTYTGLVNALDSTATLTTTWQRFTYTVTFGSNITEINPYFQWDSVGTAGTNDYVEITGVQLELGSTATTFSRAGGTIQGELAACQRYYFRFTGPGAYSAYAFGAYGGTTTGYILMDYPVTLRTTPSSLDYANLAVQLTDGGGPVAVTNLALDQNSLKNQTLLFTVGSAGTAFRPCRLLNNNNAAGYVGLNAEL